MSTKEKVLRWGICGGGYISNDFVLALYTIQNGGHKVQCVATRDISKAKEFAERLNIPRAYGSYQELMNDPDIDVVYIGVIHPFHKELCLQALSAGKHVLCEKPLAMNLKQATDIINFAKEKKLFFMEAVWSRFFPVYEEIRINLNHKTVGDVKLVDATFCIPIADVPRSTKKSLGASSTMDIGIYTIQFAMMVFNGEKPEKISACGHINDEGIDTNANITLMYKGGRMARLACDISVRSSCRASIYGTKGKLEIPDFMWSPTTLLTPGGKLEFELPKSVTQINSTHGEGLSYEAEAVRQCIMKDQLESPLMTHKDTLQLAGIMDEILLQLGVVYDDD